MTEYGIKNQQQTGTAMTGFCLQCGKTVGPPPGLSEKKKDEHGNVIGLLHRGGDCKEKWEKDHPKS